MNPIPIVSKKPLVWAGAVLAILLAVVLFFQGDYHEAMASVAMALGLLGLGTPNPQTLAAIEEALAKLDFLHQQIVNPPAPPNPQPAPPVNPPGPSNLQPQAFPSYNPRSG